VLTLVLDRTVFRFVASVWSTSDSSRAAAGVIAGGVTIWFACGDCSRSHLTL
jgi:hypothetical protein